MRHLARRVATSALLPSACSLFSILGASRAHADYTLTTGSNVDATGRALSSGEQALLDQMVDEIDAALPGWKEDFEEWQAAGGEVGVLTGGEGMGVLKSGADSDTILISIDDHPDWSMKKARLLHEFMHAQRGWLLGGDSHAVDACTHAWIWAETIHSMLIPCDIDGNVTCAQFQAMLNEYEAFAEDCGPTAAGCVISSPPPCCVTWIGAK